MAILTHKFPPNLASLYDEELTNQLANTQGMISSLNQLPKILHNASLLMNPILGKEAESSAQLEGTQASIEDAYKIDIVEQTPEKRNEAIEIKNYKEAMIEGIAMLKNTNLNSAFIKGIHKTLLSGVRGERKHPGQYRTGDVWIGTEGTNKDRARYIPPDAVYVESLMGTLEQFIKDSKTIHPLIACGIIHHRFEGIHPFEDGNGRAGRILISLYLIEKKILDLPVLYPSGYFEKNRENYMAELSKVDKKEDWRSWLLFFLKALETQAKVSLDVGYKIDELFKSSKTIVQKEKASLNLIRVLEFMFTQPYVTAPIVSKNTGIPLSSCKRYLATLNKREIIDDIGIALRQRVYANMSLLQLLRRI